jgi:hypothetical protein
VQSNAKKAAEDSDDGQAASDSRPSSETASIPSSSVISSVLRTFEGRYVVRSISGGVEVRSASSPNDAKVYQLADIQGVSASASAVVRVNTALSLTSAFVLVVDGMLNLNFCRISCFNSLLLLLLFC